MIALPLVLLVAANGKPPKAAQLLRAGCAGELDLIALPPHEVLPRLFERTLRRQSQSWPVSLEVNSADLVARYVQLGLGVGLAADSPLVPLPENVVAVKLSKFPKLPVVALWKGQLPVVPAAFLELMKTRARQFTGP